MPSPAPLLLVSLALLTALGCRDPEPGPRPDVLFLTIDTLRADHLPLYGYERDTMPHVAALAGEAVTFDQAAVPRSSTRPSYASMLTGLYPYRHGVRSNWMELHGDVATLPERLRDEGYHTAAFVSNFAMVGELSGLAQGFDIYDDRVDEREGGARASYERSALRTVEAILEWLASDPPRPFFLLVNLIDPHGPYRPPPPWRGLFESETSRPLEPALIPPYQRIDGSTDFYEYVDRYDGEIRYADEALGLLIKELRGRGLWDDALVVFTADHGEALGEHGVYFEHHVHLFEETVRVPFLVRLPRGQAGGTRVDTLASPLDLVPTVFDFLGISAKASLDGRSLRPILEGAPDPERTLLLEFPAAATPGATHPDVWALRTATHKLVRVTGPLGAIRQQVVYDLRVDPLEQQARSLDPDDPVHRRLAEELDRKLAQVEEFELPFPVTEYMMPFEDREAFVEGRARGRVMKELTPDQAERLRALGYVE